jgi:hypothetical protein
MFDEIIVQDPDLGQYAEDLLACDWTFFDRVKINVESEDQSL